VVTEVWGTQRNFLGEWFSQQKGKAQPGKNLVKLKQKAQGEAKEKKKIKTSKKASEVWFAFGKGLKTLSNR